jgi:hypothetical protein
MLLSLFAQTAYSEIGALPVPTLSGFIQTSSQYSLVLALPERMRSACPAWKRPQFKPPCPQSWGRFFDHGTTAIRTRVKSADCLFIPDAKTGIRPLHSDARDQSS